ncbi:hypothetical protein [Zhihengliuella halotolerans]|uniref:Uncharacterized protein n=1 Tax=Zhihengliuella halotolerans TaxID=370736 RepID=A0A4Q8AAD9_9MICC|nr:hypothetical protein [Zhihengliuella halotolerans]RZU61072.1 hypothetical protein EV380_0629 [Zhihengliuella halotolerans]
MLTRRDAAIALDIPLEMAKRHDLPARLSESDLQAILSDPPAWLVQSRANRRGKRPVWLHLTCTVCGFTEAVRPKKWWPEFDFLYCASHPARDLPPTGPGLVRCEYEEVGTRLNGIVDEPGDPA